MSGDISSAGSSPSSFNIPDQSTLCTGSCGCSVPFKISEKYSTGDSCPWMFNLDYNGKNPKQSRRHWYADIYVNPNTLEIGVVTRLLFTDETKEYKKYLPPNYQIPSDLFAKNVREIPNHIHSYWDNKYSINIEDAKCPPVKFKVRFKVLAYTSISQAGGNPIHYEVTLRHIDPAMARNKGERQSVFRSNVAPNGTYKAMFNTYSTPSSMYAHEYGHMIGLLDAYRDLTLNLGGVLFRPNNGSGDVAHDKNGPSVATLPEVNRNYERTGGTINANGNMMGHMADVKSTPKEYMHPLVYVLQRKFPKYRGKITGWTVNG